MNGGRCEPFRISHTSLPALDTSVKGASDYAASSQELDVSSMRPSRFESRRLNTILPSCNRSSSFPAHYQSFGSPSIHAIPESLDSRWLNIAPYKFTPMLSISPHHQHRETNTGPISSSPITSFIYPLSPDDDFLPSSINGSRPNSPGTEFDTPIRPRIVFTDHLSMDLVLSHHI